MSRLTSEQSRVVASNARLLAVDAFAGTGKTHTLVEFACARQGARILYIAFNRSVANEAAERFPRHVACKTTHSLAFNVVGRNFRDKLGNAQPFEVAQALKCNHRRAKAVLDTVSAWHCSTDPEIAVKHVDDGDVLDPQEAAVIADQARAVWEHMQSSRSTIRMPHDGYLKLWAMSKPRLPYDIILLDEAQDTNPLTLDLVLNQRHAQLVLVGDKHQGIYGFRKAMNAMEAVEATERVALTQSFRFGQPIADIATILLQEMKEERHAVKGRDDIDVQWTIDTSRPYAMIGRTNAGLFGAAAEVVLGERECRLHFVGGFDSYLFGKVLDAYYLWSDDRSRIKDSTVSRFASFEDFRKYGDEAQDAEVRALVKTVEQYRQQVPRIYNAMKAAETPSQDRANITLSTAHRAKGLEWDQVHLADDFIELPVEDDEDFDPEEVNLLYVAVSRAIRAVRLPASLMEWLRSVGWEPVGAQEAAKEDEARPWHTEEGHEAWLRENHGRFGEAAQELAFLIRRLDEVRTLVHV